MASLISTSLISLCSLLAQSLSQWTPRLASGSAVLKQEAHTAVGWVSWAGKGSLLPPHRTVPWQLVTLHKLLLLFLQSHHAGVGSPPRGLLSWDPGEEMSPGRKAGTLPGREGLSLQKGKGALHGLRLHRAQPPSPLVQQRLSPESLSLSHSLLHLLPGAAYKVQMTVACGTEVCPPTVQST